MARRIVASLLFPLVVCCASQARADIIAPDLPAGSQYQLIFFTADLVSQYAEPSNVAYYNAFVNSEAALNPELPSGLVWNAVVSTTTVDASVNAPSLPGLPIYNTQGIEVASGATGLYGGTLLNAVQFNQYGTKSNESGGGPDGPLVFTGSNPDGTADIALGASPIGVTFGNGAATDGTWADASTGTPGTYAIYNLLYGLSGPVTTAPEPSTWLMLATGAVALLVRGKCKRRSQVCAGSASPLC